VADLAAWQVGWQRRSLGLLLLVSGPGCRLQRVDLGGHRCQVHVQRLFQQALLLGGVRLALCGELQPLEYGVLVRELVDDGLLEGQLGTRRAHQLTQLLGFERVQLLVGDHECRSCRRQQPCA
jgi:hypothetical protein